MPLLISSGQIEGIPFRDRKALRETLLKRQHDLNNHETQDQYLTFTSVPKCEVESLTDASFLLKIIRFTYKPSTETLRAKLMITPEHEILAKTLSMFTDNQLNMMDLL